MSTFSTIDYQRPAPKVVRIVLDRAERRNAQSYRMLDELNDAMNTAARDDEVSVIILAGNGPHFSAGHDFGETEKATIHDDFDLVGIWCGFGCEGAQGRMAVEKELYLGLCERWRNLPKPTIAEVRGKVISGGLMLAWPCDLIVAATDAEFIDNTVTMGLNGAEFFAHPWELGPRKAKEMLFTAEPVTASDALRLAKESVNAVQDPRAASTA